MSCTHFLNLSLVLAGVCGALEAASPSPCSCLQEAQSSWVEVGEAQCLVQSIVQVNKPDHKLDVSPFGLAGSVNQGSAPRQTTKLRSDAVAPPDEPDAWEKALSFEANGFGDLAVLGLSFLTNGVVLVACIVSFCFLRLMYPEVYENNARSPLDGGLGTAPFRPSSELFGWLTAARSLSQEQLRAACGVDEMMLIEFSHFSMRLLLIIGAPLICLLCPLHFFLGGGQVDRLSKVGMANVRDESPLLWVHVIAVWYVVIVTVDQVHRTMARFLNVRVRWLLELEPPRSTTVLVEGIPERRRSDAELKAYFEMLFPGCVESAYIVKRTGRLCQLTKERENVQLRLERAMFEWQKDGEDENRRPTFYPAWFMRLFSDFVDQNDKIDHYRELVSELDTAIVDERERVLLDASEPMMRVKGEQGEEQKALSTRAKAVNSHAGFVTFVSEREARLMLSTRCTTSLEEFISHVPPPFTDVIYEDLQVEVNQKNLWHFVGYACILCVFCSFLPLICGSSTLASFQAFERNFHINPHWRVVFEGVISSLVLTTFTSFLPTILMTVFTTFFVLRANAWAQLKLQTWLFWFNLIFVVLVTALGGTLIGRIKEIAQNPFTVLDILASSLPRFTHFYLNFMLMQWVVHGLNLTRYIQLTKYLIWRSIVGTQRAVELTEPEDQDYYGIGSRSALWSINLVIAIVFCTLCPLILVFTFVNFLISRVVYSYLVVFAETKKADLGGPFFVTKLWHVQYGLLVYVVLMIGVIWHRSNNIAMTVITSFSLVHVLFGAYVFDEQYQWEALPFEELCTEEALEDFKEEMDRYRALGERRPSYRQQELFEQEMLRDSSHLEELRKQRRFQRLCSDVDKQAVDRNSRKTRRKARMSATADETPKPPERWTTRVAKTFKQGFRK